MSHFHYSRSHLICEQVPVAEIAGQVDTPFYLYSRRTYCENFEVIDRAFGSHTHQICYALKANSNLDILRDLSQRGAGADVVSLGELRLAQRAGIPATRIVFAGVGKRDDEIAGALQAGIRGFNVESEAELRVIDELARSKKVIAPVALRINPGIDVHGHPYISTGRAADKFGIERSRARALFHEIQSFSGVKLVGLHAHVGSQITELAPFAAVGEVLAELAHQARAAGHCLDYIDAGGGLGVVYENAIRVAADTDPAGGLALDPDRVAQTLLASLGSVECEIIFEPGRALVATSGALVTRVLYTKETGGKRFVVVDAGMSDLLRPSLYHAYHQIVPVRLEAGKTEKVDVVGPICESGDFLARDRELQPVVRGDLLAIMTAGAYGFSLSSNYNARPRPAEVIVDGKQFKVSRPRQEVGRIWES